MNSAPRLQSLALRRAVAELVVDDAVFDGAEHAFLLDQPARAGNIAGAQNSAGKPQAVEDDFDELVECFLLLGRKLHALPDLCLDAVGKAQMDDVAGVLEIADIEHDLERPAAVVRRNLVLGEFGHIGLDVVLVGVQPFIENPGCP